MTEVESSARPTRRRASRAAGPAGGEAATTAVSVDSAAEPVKRRPTPVGAPRRRRAHRTLVVLIALVVGLVGITTLAVCLG